MPRFDEKPFAAQLVNLIVLHLGKVIAQASPTDDHILLDHVRRAHAAAIMLQTGVTKSEEVRQ